MKTYFQKMTSFGKPLTERQFAAMEGNVKLIRQMEDEVVPFPAMRAYMCAFVQAAYQNPVSICPPHLMLLPRLIQG